MKNNWPKWPRRFGLIYGIVLAVFTTYVLLDTFVIPKGMVVVSSSEVSSAQTSVNTGTDTVTADDADYYGNTGNNTASVDSDDNTGTNASNGVSGSRSYDEATEAAEADADESSGTSDSKGAAATSDPVVTDTSYDDGNISISYTTERINDTTCYIVDIQVSDVSYLNAAFANNTYGRNIKETTSDMAEEHNAILAINGDYYGFRDYGYVLRNGVLYRSTSGNGEDLVIDSDGTMRIIEESEVSAEELEEAGAWQVLSFGPALINNGEIVVGENEEVDQSMNSNPRTAIGMISPLHYVIVVSDGRTDESEGLTLYELAQVFEERGATVAYNLDGGGSSTLWFNGEVINNPAGGRSGNKERSVSDILYF